jgi:2-polyprenyl-3-methyl-5-hydroxy-6-metoxy-1,4-benzoquinol methylase
VDFYALLKPGEEPAIVHAAASTGARATVLDLGAGTGRIADALVALGHPVTAVDESPEMLARVKSAETVCATIQELALGRRFDVVLLASHLVNTPDEAQRAAFLETCARHVADDGCVIIEQHPPQWFDSVTATERDAGDFAVRLTDVSRPAPDLLSATVEYRVGDRTWTQSFTAARLAEPALRAALAAAGLAFDGYLTDNREWLRARLAAPAR